jgi:hypothetical protein
VLSRIRVQDLLSLELGELEMLVEGGAWRKKADTAELKAVLPSAVPEMTLQYNEQLKQWVAMEVETVLAQLVLWTADKPEGPWTFTPVYNITAPYDDLTVYR